jgi:6-phosphogluconolactonase
MRISNLSSDWRQDFQPEIKVIQDYKQLIEKIAHNFIWLCCNILKNKSRATLVLGGGRTPRLLNHHIVSLSPKYDIDWKRIFVFFSDDRCTPPDHPDSNYRMIKETLLGFIGIPESNVHRIQGEYGPEKAALIYENDLKRFFGNVRVPEFDLVLLGIGADGHTASLFPKRMSLYEQQKLVVPAGRGPEGHERVTMSYPVLNKSKNIWFLIAGEEKKNILRKLQYGDFEPVNCPAQGIKPENGSLVYFTDQNFT